MTVGDIIAEGLDIHGLAQGEERRQKVIELLKTVGLNEEHADRFPMSSVADSDNGSGLPAPSQWTPTLSSLTNPFPRWMCPFRPKWST